MKGGCHGLRGKQVSLTLIALICTTIFIWAWDKSPLLTTFLPPQGRLLVPSPETLLDAPKPDISLREDISHAVPEGDTRTEQTEKSSNIVTSIDSTSESTSEKSIDAENNIDSSIEKKDISLKEDVSNAVPEGETRTEQAEKSSNVVESFGSATRSTPETSIHDGDNIVTSIEKKGE